MDGKVAPTSATRSELLASGSVSESVHPLASSGSECSAQEDSTGRNETVNSFQMTSSSSTHVASSSSGKRASRRLRKVLLKGSGMPELARPSLAQVVECEDYY
jgi:hypothetical protein